jgi:Zn finger protein HypA/HybF involved in hydrogenase expression
MASKKEPLSVTHPELAAQAHGWDPATLAAGAAKIVGWKCATGHFWSDSVSHRSSGRGCPVCSNKRVLIGFNDLATTHPELAQQVDGWDPTTVTAGSGRSVGWICTKDHKWTATVASRSSRGRGCPICSNRITAPGFNDLATTHPELAQEADGWDPTTLTAGSSKKVGWRCKLGHTWPATVKDRSIGDGCAVCSNKRVLVGFNDLVTTNPELAAQADGWDPTTVVQFSQRKLQWRCKLGHTWQTTVASRSSGSGCPVCSGHQVSSGYNDLATTHPELAAQANGWDPTTLTAGSDVKASWKCQQGHTWNAAVSSRAGNSRGCPVCAGKAVLVGYNDLATTHPELAAQANGWDPTTLTAGSSKKKVQWLCVQGHVWNADVVSRSVGQGCPVCAGKAVLVGYNDLATTHPELAAQANGWDPTTLTAGSSKKKVQWLCVQGHVWKSLIRDRARGIGCPSCASGGFDPNQKGWLYLVHHIELKMFQVGISNVPKRRLGEHSRRGWEILEIRGPMEGHLAQQLETEILHAVERRGAVLGHKTQIEKFDGYSEAWTKDSLMVTDFKQILDWVYDDDHAMVQTD